MIIAQERAEVLALRDEVARPREALVGVTRVLSETIDWHDRSHSYGDECPWEMQEVFEDDDRAALATVRAALKGDT